MNRSTTAVITPSSWEPANWDSLTHSADTTRSPHFWTSASGIRPLMECNHQPYDSFSYTIRVTLMVPVLIFGFAANAMNVIVFREERMRTSMVNWYLVVLAITDTGVLFSSFCMLSLPVICEDFDSLTLFNLGVSAQRWTYALGLTMQTASVGMTVLVSAHRFLGVVFPFRAQQWCTTKRIKTAIWSVVVFAVSFNVPRWFELSVDACRSSIYNATGLRLVQGDLRQDNLYYSAYMVLLYTLFMFALPFLLLIVMNALIVRTVHRSYRMRQMLTNKISTGFTSASTRGLLVHDSRKPSPSSRPPFPISPQHQQEQFEKAQTAHADNGVVPGSNSTTGSAKENKTTIMLIAVVFVFLICNSLAFINYILEILTVHGLPVMEVYLMLVEVSNFLVVINSASNIFIYWTFSARYRILFRRYIASFCCCFSPCATVCAGSLRRAHHQATTTPRRRAIIALADGRSPANRLLPLRKNSGHDDVDPMPTCPGGANLVSLRQDEVGSGPCATASITKHHAPAESELDSKFPRQSSQFRYSQRQESRARESPLSEAASNNKSESVKNSAVSRV